MFTDSLVERDLVDVDVAEAKPAARVLQVEVPHPLEDPVEAEVPDPVAVGEERLVPQAQRLGVVLAERQPVGHPQRGVPGRDLLDRPHRRQEAAGEDVLVDPRVGVFVASIRSCGIVIAWMATLPPGASRLSIFSK